MSDITQLAAYFNSNILEKYPINDVRMKHTEASISNFLNLGWTIETIKEELDSFKRSYPQAIYSIYHIDEILGGKQPPNNLIEADIFYYHDELRITSKPSRLHFNKETRTYERNEDAFFLEMKKVFTLNNLLKYWYESNGVRVTDHKIKQDTGRFKYLLEYYDIDEILFMIDAAQEIREEFNHRPLVNAFQLEKYIDQAKDKIKAKKNIHVSKGINQVIPRKVV